MLRPSYSDLMEVINKQSGNDDSIASRYTIVIATAKRARMLVDGEEPLVIGNPDKSVSLAIKEIFYGHVRIVPPKHQEENEIAIDNVVVTE